MPDAPLHAPADLARIESFELRARAVVEAVAEWLPPGTVER